MTLTNSTISSNSAGDGGGIYNQGTLTLINSTISGNSAAGNGGGIYYTDFGVFNCQNTIIAGNTAGGRGPDLSGLVTSLGNNLIGKTDGRSG